MYENLLWGDDGKDLGSGSWREVLYEFTDGFEKLPLMKDLCSFV
jgi:hypothetical protein